MVCIYTSNSTNYLHVQTTATTITTIGWASPALEHPKGRFLLDILVLRRKTTQCSVFILGIWTWECPRPFHLKKRRTLWGVSVPSYSKLVFTKSSRNFNNGISNAISSLLESSSNRTLNELEKWRSWSVSDVQSTMQIQKRDEKPYKHQFSTAI